jgi:hypothetical protein
LLAVDPKTAEPDEGVAVMTDFKPDADKRRVATVWSVSLDLWGSRSRPGLVTCGDCLLQRPG